MEDDRLIRGLEGEVTAKDADVPDSGLDLFQADRPHRPDREGEHVRVRRQRRTADDFGVQLEELAVAAFLRLLIPEYVPRGVDLDWLWSAP